MSKGSSRRPSAITKEEEAIRYDLAFGKITQEEFDRQYAELKKQGLIKRGGKTVG